MLDNESPPLFADVLMGHMLDANAMRQSELARRMWGEVPNRRGNMVARGRDRIGHYLRGTSYPNPANLQKIADVFGVPVAELASARRPPGKRVPSIAEAKGKQLPITLTGRFTITLENASGTVV